MRGLNLWRKVTSTDGFVSALQSAVIYDLSALSRGMRLSRSFSPSSNFSEYSSRSHGTISPRTTGASNRAVSTRETDGRREEDAPKYKSRMPSRLATAKPEKVSRQEKKPHVYVTSDFADYRGMQLVFLGTSSSIPTLRRSTSCIALRLEGSIFLFDCGEGAVRQILKTPMKHYDIGNIFVTHMHGDHIYGLPGLLCRLGLKEFQNKEPIQVYGPQGLRQWIRATLEASHARVHPKYVVHELHLKKRKTNVAHSWNYIEENHEDELPGRDIQKSEDGLWPVMKDDKYTVRAGFLRHSTPCWGYVVEEHTRRGRFDVDRAREAGVKPGKYFRMLEAGDSVMLEDGTIVYPSDVLGPPRRGRKVVILGDTCDSKSLRTAAMEADVLVHEATVLEQDAAEVLQRGHSTARMAGEFAREIRADTLVLTHFSRKLDGALFVDERSSVRETMGDLVTSAQEAFQKDNVIAAEDLMAVTVQLEDKPPLKDAQDPVPSATSREETETAIQPKVFRHSWAEEFGEDVALGSKKDEGGHSSKKPRSRRLSPAQLQDKTVFKNLQKRHSSRRRRATSISE
ncbi:hypothetical protein R1sor_015756 [Riccia sorocarpa]|uniref:Metallo-beta-lactamase domain-containing protein n=1 Tax=Riccia sorocarpa TaxID=122646 RepID=A0ABD3HD49_9MARC